MRGVHQTYLFVSILRLELNDPKRPPGLLWKSERRIKSPDITSLCLSASCSIKITSGSCQGVRVQLDHQDSQFNTITLLWLFSVAPLCPIKNPRTSRGLTRIFSVRFISLTKTQIFFNSFLFFFSPSCRTQTERRYPLNRNVLLMGSLLTFL